MNNKLATVCAILATAWLTTGCSTGGSPSGDEQASPEIGNLGLPLSSTSASGVEYRLRNADFDVWGYQYDCWDYDDCEDYDESFSSEDYLEEPSIMLDLLEGDYEIHLGGEWYLERIVDGEAEAVEAVLLNDPWQWAWVSPHSTSWVTFQFGIGDEELWLNGQLNVQIEVYEDPDEYYGGDWECYEYCDEYGCWEECCREYCNEEGCSGECSIGEPGQPMPGYGESTRSDLPAD